MRAAQLGFQKPPAVKGNSEFEANRNANSGHVEDVPDFTQLMQSSNVEREKELAAERDATAGGQINLGETKTDQEFRGMLEKITGKKQERIKTKLDKDDYLNLMVTQLKHQDPTKPMDNQEMAQQLAQFNTVEQLISANQTLQKMASGQAEAKIDKLSPFLGKNVQVSGNKVRISTEGQVTDAHYDIPEDTANISFNVKDATGKVVRTDSQTGVKKGEHAFKWDGRDDKGNKMGSGEYTVAVEGVSGDGKPVKAKQTFTAKVTEITDLATGGKLGTNVGSIETKDILAIKADDPPAAAIDAKAAIATTAPINATVPAIKAAADAEKPATPGEGEEAKVADLKAPEVKDKVEAKLAEHKARRKAAAEAKKSAAGATPPAVEDAVKVTEAPAAKAVEGATAATHAPSKKDAARPESSKNDSNRNADSDTKRA